MPEVDQSEKLTPREKIAGRISSLHREREQLASSIAQLEKRASEISIKISALSEVLPLLDEETEDQSEIFPQASTTSIVNGNAPKVGATVALLNCILHNPGSTQAAIVEMAAPLVSTESSDPKKVLYNTLWQLIRNGRVSRVDGKLYPKNGLVETFAAPESVEKKEDGPNGPSDG